MPINDFLNIANLIENLKFTGGGGAQAVNPLIIGGGSNVLSNQNNPVPDSRFAQTIAPGQQFGQTAGQSINDLLLRPVTDPRPPQVFNAAPNTGVLVGGQQGGVSFSPRTQDGINPEVANLLKLVLNAPGIGGSETGAGGFPGSEETEGTPGFGSFGGLGGLGGGEGILGGLSNLGTGLNIANTIKNISFGINRAIGGKDVDRNIGVPAFSFGDVPEGSPLAAYGELGASDPLVARALNLTEFSAFENLFPPRYNLAISAANNTLSALDELGLTKEAGGLRSIIEIVNDDKLGNLAPRDAIQERFSRVQQLWDAITKSFEPLIQETIGGLSEQDRDAFNTKRSQRTANELLPQFQSRFKGNTEILTTQQSTQGGDPEVKVLGGGQEVPFIAANEPFNLIGPDNQIRTNTLGSLQNRIEEFLNTIGR